jgi:hypothetical protein
MTPASICAATMAPSPSMSRSGMNSTMIEARDPGLFGHPADQLQHLPVAQAPGRAPDHRGHDRGVQRVDVQADDHLRALGDQVDRPPTPSRATSPAGTKLDAPVQRILHVGLPGRADAAAADLHDPLDMAHLAGAAHGRGQAQPFAPHLVAPVDMGVDLQDGKGAAARAIGLKHRDRQAVVAADQEGHAAAVQHLADRAEDPGAVSRRVGLVLTGRSPASTASDRAGKDRPADIEIHMRQVRRIGRPRRADGRRPARAIEPDRRIRRAAIGPDQRDLRRQARQVVGSAAGR